GIEAAVAVVALEREVLDAERDPVPADAEDLAVRLDEHGRDRAAVRDRPAEHGPVDDAAGAERRVERAVRVEARDLERAAGQVAIVPAGQDLAVALDRERGCRRPAER